MQDAQKRGIIISDTSLVKVDEARAIEATAEKQRAYRAELAQMKLSELKAKARDIGMDEDAIDEVDDEDDPKAA
eukprot:SAG31_NODE_6109_length_2167_cov_3.984526_1_plen_73_part_10